jgi:hypothetical protein
MRDLIKLIEDASADDPIGSDKWRQAVLELAQDEDH